MFIPKEILFMKREIGGLLEKTQDRLDQPEVTGSERDRFEEKLITMVSIVNKLEKAIPDKNNKSTSAKVLVVDDVESMRKVHRHYLLDCGFRDVSMAEDGLRGYAMLKKAHDSGMPFDLVVSDWEMPKVTGLELLKKVRTDKKLWRTPFFLITSLGDKKHILEAINSGATGYMVKPVNQKMMTKKFSEYLNT